MIVILPGVRIEDSELEFTYARSSGPGGQNVNKVNSKAVLRWNARESAALDERARALIEARLSSRLTLDGCLVIASDRFRDQGRNREDCVEKLRALLVQALHVPKARKESRPSRSSVRRAREDKSRNSAKKRLRGRPRGFD